MQPGDSPGDYPLWHNLQIAAVAVEADGGMRWNGSLVSRSSLREYLAMVVDQRPPTAVTLKVHPDASCHIVQLVRDDIQGLMRCDTSGLCGEGDGEWD